MTPTPVENTHPDLLLKANAVLNKRLIEIDRPRMISVEVSFIESPDVQCTLFCGG